MKMMNMKQWVAIGFLSFFMYVGGPLLWGAWMVFRLGLMAPGDYLRCLASPMTLALLAGFLAASLVNVGRAMQEQPYAGESEPLAGASKLRSVLRVHCLMVATFGTVGTLAFLLPLSACTGGPPPVHAGNWLRTAAVGALSGCALVFMVYGSLTATLFERIRGSGMLRPMIRTFCVVLFPVGVVFHVAASALSTAFHAMGPLDRASLAVPLVASGFIFLKTMRQGKAAPEGASHENA